MREIDADLFNVACSAIVITTNGFVKKNGEVVMGAGVAKIAAKKWPALPMLLAQLIMLNGNHVYWLLGKQEAPVDVLTMPVKHVWFDPADTLLVEQSCHELVTLANLHPSWRSICLPRPGCGNGQLSWDIVKEVIAPILDNRFVVVFPVNNWGVPITVPSFDAGLKRGEPTPLPVDLDDVEFSIAGEHHN